MTSERETLRIVRSWMEEGRTRLPDHVLDAVLDQLPATPRRDPGGRRGRIAEDENPIAKYAIAAAAVVVIAIVGLNVFGARGTSNVGGPPPSPVTSPSPLSSPSPSAAPSTACRRPSRRAARSRLADIAGRRRSAAKSRSSFRTGGPGRPTAPSRSTPTRQPRSASAGTSLAPSRRSTASTPMPASRRTSFSRSATPRMIWSPHWTTRKAPMPSMPIWLRDP